MEGLLAVVPTIPFGLLEARRHAQFRADLTRKGKVIRPHDLAIADVALAHDFALATRNTGALGPAPGLRLMPAS